MQSTMLDAWATALATWAAMPGLEMVLTLGADTYDVIFDHEAGAILARAVEDYSDPQSTDRVVPTLRFITI